MASELSVSEMQLSDIEKIVDYFLEADLEFLKAIGADKSKLPSRKEWVEKLKLEFSKLYNQKEFYYIIWLFKNKAVGHSNINNIEFGKSATMHLHLWDSGQRRNGLGLEFLKLTIPYYFKNFKLEKLICTPYSKNIAPNKTLKKLGFNFIKSYDTIPGWINFHQTINHYEMLRNDDY